MVNPGLVLGLIFYCLFTALSNVSTAAGGEKNGPPDERLGKQVYIMPGNYYIGSDEENDNKPLRTMIFKGFYLDIHPVTNGQYEEFLSRGNYRPKGPFDRNKAREFPLLPATNLTYEDAAAYAAFYKKRLPTEWEWEIAARSLKMGNFFLSPASPSQSWGHFIIDKTYYSLPVFSYPPNELGLYDMAGNVFEWTSSEYERKYLSGKYFPKYRLMVLKGGAWTNNAFDIRPSTRTPFPADRCLGWIGFRCISN